MEALLPLLGAIAQYGLAIVVAALLILGVLRVGKYVDEERARIIAERDAREARIIEERDRREKQLIAERDEWRDRALAWDARLDRVAGAFERLAKAPAPD